METPSSTRRVKRSQTLSAIKSSQENHLLSSTKDSDKCQLKSRQRTESALFDITNDSPIVGVAMQKTPSSGVVSKRNIKNTPGSGEALLRGQVKTLLQKVEGVEDVIKISMDSRPFIHLVNSPMRLLAPQVSDGLQIVIASPVVASQVEENNNMFKEKEESLRIEKSPSINRSLLLDFSDKSEIWDDNNSKDEEEEEVYSYKEEDNDEYYEEEDGLCEGMKKMSVEAEFIGKHIRFVYNSEDEEIVEAEEESPRVLHLRGVPTPGGKYDRFEDDDE